MNNYYYRDIKVPFNTLYFNKKNILTRSEMVLNFYEKIIVLILKEGIEASGDDELIEKLSTMLNIKRIFVEDFINNLMRIKAVIFESNVYKLSNQSYFGYSDKDQDILLSNIKEGKDDLEFAYLLDVDSLVTRKIIDESKVTYTEKLNKDYPETFKENIYTNLNKIKEDTILNLTRFSLKNVLVEPIKFLYEDLVDLQFNQINIPITIRYDYSYDKECGVFDSCAICNGGTINLNDLVSNKILSKFIKINYEFDEKKPDFILYLENLKEEEKKKKELEKLIKVKLENENREKEIQNEIKKKDQEIAEKEKIIKQLNAKFKALNENEEKEKIQLFKQLQEEKEEHQKTKENLKELNKEHNKVSNERNIIQKTLKEKEKEIREEHNKIYKDEFERKVFAFEQYNNSFKLKYPKIYNQNCDVIDCLLCMSKKINDKMPMDNEFGKLRNILQNYIRSIFAVLLNRNINTIDRLKAEFSENHPVERQNVVLFIRQENLDNLIDLEWCSDGYYHQNDRNTIDKQTISKELALKFKSKVEEFESFTKEIQKNKLLSLITTITKINFNEEQLKKLEENL